nr:endonuclease [Allomuricauda ochracea]
MGKAISKIGLEDTGGPPALVGIAEVENKVVIQQLLQSKALRDEPYDFVHFDSPDERGIDTALIYHKTYFKVLKSETLPLLIINDTGERDFTRDILYVCGKLNQEEIHVFVNHWPSRREGEETTRYKRIRAAETVLRKISTLGEDATNIIIIGDFNDDPNSESIERLMSSGWFINPMQKLLSPVSGSANYKGKWSLFDQILVSHTFLNHQKGTHRFEAAQVFAPQFLKEWRGKYKGNPFRTFAGRKYLGGYSDHFPVYVVLERQI